MTLVVEAASIRDDEEIKTIAKQSKYTRDFCSHMFYRNNIEQLYETGQIGKAVEDSRIVGFILAKHLKIKPYTSIYFMGVEPCMKGKGVGRELVRWAMHNSPWGVLKLVCEYGNTEGMEFYKKLKFELEYEGVVGKSKPRACSHLYIRSDNLE